MPTADHSGDQPGSFKPPRRSQRRNQLSSHYKSMLYPTFRHLNEILVRWAMRKYKRLRFHTGRARKLLAGIARREPALFAHWKLEVFPVFWTPI